MKRAGAVLLVTLLAACVAGGSSEPPGPINVSDSGVLVPGGRLSIPLGRLPQPPSATRAGHAIELGLSFGEGEDTQTLASGARPVHIGGRIFSAPQQLRHEFNFTYAEAAYRWRYFANESFGIELRAGVALADLDLTTSSATQRASENMQSLGANGSGGVVLRLAPRMGAHGRITYFVSGDDDDVTDATRVEAFLTYDLDPHFALRGGYVAWKVHSRTDWYFTRSPVYVKFSGPMVGLELMF